MRAAPAVTEQTHNRHCHVQLLNKIMPTTVVYILLLVLLLVVAVLTWLKVRIRFERTPAKSTLYMHPYIMLMCTG